METVRRGPRLQGNKKPKKSYADRLGEKKPANPQCKTCKYRARYTEGAGTGTPIGCDYSLITGHLRGCKPTPVCEKYEKGEKIKLPLKIFNPPSPRSK